MGYLDGISYRIVLDIFDVLNAKYPQQYGSV
jgi:hypothetical protein